MSIQRIILRTASISVLICLAASLVLAWQEPAVPPPSPASVQAIERPTSPLPPETASAAVTKFSFVVYGDTRGRRDGSEIQHEHQMVIDEMLATIKTLSTTAYPVKFVLQSGDAVAKGREAAQWNVSFVGLINRLTTTAGVPYFLVPGNHDVSSAADVASPHRKEGLANYLAAMANLIPPDGSARRLSGYPTFAFGYGNTFVIGLDSNIATDPTQLEWVRGQLEGIDKARFVNIVAFFHHPPFSSGPHGGAHVEEQAQALRDLYMPLFRAHHVRLLLAGHEHLFEHWVERYADARGKWRMDMIVTGGGGAPIYTYQGEPDTSAYSEKYAAEQVSVEHVVRPGPDQADNPYHFVVVRVDGVDLSLDVVGVDWGSDFKPYRSNGTTLQ
jgi:3',5'-cyclic AMP phosphodiesterase CpdA